MITVDKIKVASAITEIAAALSTMRHARSNVRGALQRLDRELVLGIDTNTEPGAALAEFRKELNELLRVVDLGLAKDPDPADAIDSLRQLVGLEDTAQAVARTWQAVART